MQVQKMIDFGKVWALVEVGWSTRAISYEMAFNDEDFAHEVISRISYGGDFTAPDVMRIATIPVGYGDGYPRSLSGKGSVLIHGKRAPILGRICMDQFMVDVTGIPETVFGDQVTLIGTDGDETITVEELADLSGRFNYEFVCDLNKRIPRVYYHEGDVVGSLDFFESEQS